MNQAALPFPHSPGYDPQDFIAAPANEAALAWLAEPAAWPAGRLALAGPAGCGKTHLLHKFAARWGVAVQPGAALPAIAMPSGPALAIDDAEASAAEPLLHVLNAAADSGMPVLLAARAPPSRWPFELPDLVSRLRATTAVTLQEPDDALLHALLARLLADRQLVVSAALQTWLVRRLPRTGAALREAAARLDAAALEAGGGVTRLLAARALNLDETDPFA